MLCWPRGVHHGHERSSRIELEVLTFEAGHTHPLHEDARERNPWCNPTRLKVAWCINAAAWLALAYSQVSGLNLPLLCLMAWTLFRSSSNFLTSSACSAFFFSRSWNR